MGIHIGVNSDINVGVKMGEIIVNIGFIMGINTGVYMGAFYSTELYIHKAL